MWQLPSLETFLFLKLKRVKDSPCFFHKQEEIRFSRQTSLNKVLWSEERSFCIDGRLYSWHLFHTKKKIESQGGKKSEKVSGKKIRKNLVVWNCLGGHSWDLWPRSHSSVERDWFGCVTWLIWMCDMTHSDAWHESFGCVTRLVRMCDMTHSDVWHDSFGCVTWLIRMCNVTHSDVWHDPFGCVIRHNHYCRTKMETLQSLCCSVLQCGAMCCSVVQCVAVCCSVLQCVAGCCRVLQCVAVCCSVLQCVAVETHQSLCCGVWWEKKVVHNVVTSWSIIILKSSIRKLRLYIYVV